MSSENEEPTFRSRRWVWVIRNPGDYPTEATSGAGQRHHQAVAVDEVIDRVMSRGTVSAAWDLVKGAPFRNWEPQVRI
jgi:hypothetical protein